MHGVTEDLPSHYGTLVHTAAALKVFGFFWHATQATAAYWDTPTLVIERWRARNSSAKARWLKNGARPSGLEQYHPLQRPRTLRFTEIDEYGF